MLPPEKPAVVVIGLDYVPALVTLAADVGFAGLALGIERIKGSLETFLRRFAGIDGAANLAHSVAAFCARRLVPKNAGPDQRVPVMTRAISERLR